VKAIIIEEKDCKNLLQRLELAKFTETEHYSEERIGKGKFAIEAIHRAFHYQVTMWLQEQGSDGLSH
jgi:hypothetical protein